ncbi:MAG: hypothetical protein ABH873_00590 [Candidatus Firestonebacteria bacterium]
MLIEKFILKNVYKLVLTNPTTLQVKSGNIQIYSIKGISEFVKSNNIKIAILTVPGVVAQEISEVLISSGICGILNFAPVNLKVTEEIIVSNVNLAIELEKVIYFVNAIERSKDNVKSSMKENKR